MGNRSITRALREESAKNISTAMAMTGDTEWLKVSTPDLRNVMDELHRLQRVESTLKQAINLRLVRAEAARQAGDEAARLWEIEEKINRRNEERNLRDEAYMLTRIANGEEIS